MSMETVCGNSIAAGSIDGVFIECSIPVRGRSRRTGRAVRCEWDLDGRPPTEAPLRLTPVNRGKESRTLIPQPAWCVSRPNTRTLHLRSPERLRSCGVRSQGRGNLGLRVLERWSWRVTPVHAHTECRNMVTDNQRRGGADGPSPESKAASEVHSKGRKPTGSVVLAARMAAVRR